ncbi:transcriptional regulator [Mycolicibacterium murale]|uniref:Transcriptional regulator n=1 Tax=Mycolicibacterium murale TaxID=182220 RepID=A0A7I9WN43_9MYCO|nr:helix-turn-helix domain-containing protein [Mycolicibacterium murale]MCV7185939.1 helix-turn-helix transcriptional regulator [Mycolicibacterium murale]GFG58758.1 transcriptional regulator [Mycolicibacterium murale]
MSSRRTGPDSELHGRRSQCAIAGVLDLVGDRWSLLIVRDLWLRGPLRFQDFACMVGQESVPTNTLAARLRLLEDADILTKAKYQDNPARFTYELTAKGVALVPILESMAAWGVTFIPDTRGFV